MVCVTVSKADVCCGLSPGPSRSQSASSIPASESSSDRSVGICPSGDMPGAGSSSLCRMTAMNGTAVHVVI